MPGYLIMLVPDPAGAQGACLAGDVSDGMDWIVAGCHDSTAHIYHIIHEEGGFNLEASRRPLPDPAGALPCRALPECHVARCPRRAAAPAVLPPVRVSMHSTAEHVRSCALPTAHRRIHA